MMLNLCLQKVEWIIRHGMTSIHQYRRRTAREKATKVITSMNLDAGDERIVPSPEPVLWDGPEEEEEEEVVVDADDWQDWLGAAFAGGWRKVIKYCGR